MQDSFINSVINGVNSVLNEVGGYAYLVRGKGLFVYDKPMDENPTMAIMMGGGFLRIADGKNSQGEWEWRTAATGHGLVADELVVGVITGGSNSWNLETGDLMFEQGIIRDAQGNNYWNMTTGDFKLSPGALVGSSEIGKTTVSTEVQYGHSESASVEPTDWGSDGTWRQGEYLWSRVKCTAIDGTVTYEGEKIIANDKGMGGVTTPQWYLSDSSTAQHGGSWQDSQPTWVKDHYYWTRNKTTWSDGTTTYDTPVLAQGVTSANQAVNDLDESLDVEGVFNRLTNNGSIKGIYMEGGQLYINASYIMSGIINANLLRAGRIQSKVGGTYWDLDTGEMQLDFSGVDAELDDVYDELDSLGTQVTTAQNRANSAYNRAGTAISDASAAQSTADTAYSRATSAKAKTDKITFTTNGMTCQGTNGRTYTAMTYGSDGIMSAGSFAGIETSEANMTIKNWGFYAGSNSGDVRMYVTKGEDAGGTGDPVFVAETTGVSFVVASDGVTLNGRKLAFE